MIYNLENGELYQNRKEAKTKLSNSGYRKALKRRCFLYFNSEILDKLSKTIVLKNDTLSI